LWHENNQQKNGCNVKPLNELFKSYKTQDDMFGANDIFVQPKTTIVE